MFRTRTVTVCTAALAALGALSACSSSGGGAGATSPAPMTSSSAGSAAPGSAAPGSTTSGSTTAGASTGGGSGAGGASASAQGGGASAGRTSSQCAETQLRAKVTPDDIKGLARHVVRVSFTNISHSSCTLTGFPGAAIEDGSGKQVQEAKRVVGGLVGGTIEQQSGPVTLRAGATAYAFLEGSSTKEQGAAQAGCDGPKYPRILITPPNTRIAVPFTIGWPQCYSFDIHPVRIDT